MRYILLSEGDIPMDMQMKKGLLEVCVLAAIRDEESYGYRIVKELRPVIDISESTLYPILRRLEENKLLSVRSAEHRGRLRKYYTITDAGRARLAAFDTEWLEILAIRRYITERSHA